MSDHQMNVVVERGGMSLCFSLSLSFITCTLLGRSYPSSVSIVYPIVCICMRLCNCDYIGMHNGLSISQSETFVSGGFRV